MSKLLNIALLLALVYASTMAYFYKNADRYLKEVDVQYQTLLEVQDVDTTQDKLHPAIQSEELQQIYK